jgi:hypothetical protein
VTPPPVRRRRVDPAELDRAIEWRAEALPRMSAARDLLEGLFAGLPVSMERIQVEGALKSVRRAEATCSDNLRAGRRMRDEEEAAS